MGREEKRKKETNLSETLMGLPRELLGSPSSGNSLESVTLGDTDDIDDLVLLCEAEGKEGRRSQRRRNEG